VTNPWLERRREPRIAASGEVTLYLDQPVILEIAAQLLDVSSSGFRAKHMYPALQNGMIIHVRIEEVESSAIVVWNRISEDSVETGFILR
jgi:PilZ domain